MLCLIRRGQSGETVYLPKPRELSGRLVLSPYQWRKMKREMWENEFWMGQPVCALCQEPILSFEDFEPDHIIPRGMGGGSRDDRPANLQPSHRWCNREKGSKR